EYTGLICVVDCSICICIESARMENLRTRGSSSFHGDDQHPCIVNARIEDHARVTEWC
ncbi:42914_t:CDS:1, partial [Gigaspora margarita]